MDFIIQTLEGLHPVLQALVATLFSWAVTALGASLVFATSTMNQKFMDVLFGFAGGVMLAASFWSLLAPAMEMSVNMAVPKWFPAAAGFLAGALFLYTTDKVLPHLHVFQAPERQEGLKTNWKRSILLVMAITLHNIPEGLAVGVAFGGAALGLESASLGGAVVLAIGIGIQNFPEGFAVALPLRREGFSQRKSFFYGQMSGIVEPLAGMLGAVAILWMQPILPYALAFAAGSMVFVVVEEVIPESQGSGNGDLATLGIILGFIVMMILDVALG